MSPEMIGIFIGVIFVVPTIYFIEKCGYGHWAWPTFLVTLPVYYMAFGLIVLDFGAVLLEFLYGLPYIITGLVLLKVRFGFAHLLTALAWLSHGLYDYYHDLFFVNPGVFGWYPAFCALVDIAIGGYLLMNIVRHASRFGNSPEGPGR